MKQYLEILEEILEKGTWKEPARENMPRTIDRFSIEKRFDLTKGFPLLTTKKMYWKGILHEIIWMLKGDTNIKYLVDNNVSIWTDNAYKFYLKKRREEGLTEEGDYNYSDFIDTIKKGILQATFIPDFKIGDLGCIYSHQWRRWNSKKNIDALTEQIVGYIKGVDQIWNVIDSLKSNPYSRYHIVTAWNPSEMFKSAQPNCHIMFQFNCRKMTATERENYVAYRIDNFDSEQRAEMNPNMNDIEVNEMYDKEGIPQYYLDCKMVQRSCDTFLGVPFNIGQYAFLTHIIAKFVNMVPGELIWSGNSVHIYENHIEQVKEQLKREPMELCQLNIKRDWKSINDIQFEDFEILNYQSHPAIKGELSVGL